MYKCEKCGKSTKPKEKILKVVAEYTEVEYGKIYDKKEKEYRIPKGKQIVKEMKLCKVCFGRMLNGE